MHFLNNFAVKCLCNVHFVVNKRILDLVTIETTERQRDYYPTLASKNLRLNITWKTVKQNEDLFLPTIHA